MVSAIIAMSLRDDADENKDKQVSFNPQNPENKKVKEKKYCFFWFSSDGFYLLVKFIELWWFLNSLISVGDAELLFWCLWFEPELLLALLDFGDFFKLCGYLLIDLTDSDIESVQEVK